MLSFPTKDIDERIQTLQENRGEKAYISNEIEIRLLDHLPLPPLPKKSLNMLQDCSIDILTSKKLPYENASFDAVIAHLVPMWQADIHTFFQEIRRILVPKGIFLFSTLSLRMPHELEKLGDAVFQASFENPVVDKECLQVEYDDMSALSNDLVLSGLTNDYVQVTLASSGAITATFEVIYGYALGKTRVSDKTEIPVEKITVRSIR